MAWVNSVSWTQKVEGENSSFRFVIWPLHICPLTMGSEEETGSSGFQPLSHLCWPVFVVWVFLFIFWFHTNYHRPQQCRELETQELRFKNTNILDSSSTAKEEYCPLNVSKACLSPLTVREVTTEVRWLSANNPILSLVLLLAVGMVKKQMLYRCKVMCPGAGGTHL